MYNIRQRSADAWGDYIEAHVNEGWHPFLLTFMFEPLAGIQTTKMDQMSRLLEAAYAIFVTRVVRKPRVEAVRGSAPIWLCAPDLPCFKRKKKYSLRNIVVNDGLHYHAILLLPPWSRLSDVQMHFENLRPIYRQHALLDHVDVEPIIGRFRYVQGYGYKSILKMHFDVGDDFVLPRALKELAA